jgi:cytidylate kinase
MKARVLTEAIQQAITEGVYDPSIFKAIFLAGGPGSGKSYVARMTTGGHGFKVINSDEFFEYLTKQAGRTLDMRSFTPQEMEASDLTRAKAKMLTKHKMTGYLEGKLGLVIDGTGKDFDKIDRQRKEMESRGYDTFMIFVNTSLEVAKQRNLLRDRSVPDEIVEKGWSQVQQNMGKFQMAFGANNFAIVDNNDSDNQRVLDGVWKKIMKFAERPIQNREAQAWITNELTKKNRLATPLDLAATGS